MTMQLGAELKGAAMGEGKVGVAVVVKNEEALIGEWLAFHREVGFSHAIVYDNGSTDSTVQIIEQAAKEISLELVSWPNVSHRYQVDAYEDAARRYAGILDWIAFVDADEFVLPVADRDVRISLGKLRDCSAVAVNWALFGSSGFIAAPDGLTTEVFRRRAADVCSVNQHTKMIVRPEYLLEVPNPHFVVTSGACCAPDGSPVEWLSPGITKSVVGMDRLRVNHYFVRSQADWARKIARGYNNDYRRIDEFDRYDRNDLYDESASSIGKTIRRKYKFLRDVEPSSLPVRYNGPPADFKPARYLELHPDVAQAGFDPLDHYLSFGRHEGRAYT